MTIDHPMHHASLEALTEQAVIKLRESLEGMNAWAELVRPKDGRKGCFQWAVETTRDANVAATAYLLGGLKKMGIYDEVITEDDRRDGLAWVHAMARGNDQYYDPAILDRKTPGWPEDKPWPDSGMLNGVNQYARAVLRQYSGGQEASSLGMPPPGWPQPDDDPAVMLEWIKTRPYDKNAWGACSHGMRMARWMLTWHQEGRFSLDPVIEALRFFYDIQDPETGLWGAPNQSMNVRINGAFKLFPLIREQLDLPLPHAEQLIDQVMSEFYRPNYDETVGGCDEWDNWYVIALALDQAGGHRANEIRKMAAYRIARVLEIFRKPDGGLSFFPNRCTSTWIGFDMAPSLPQSDVMGPGVLTGGINVCIDILGLHDASAWTGQWRMHADKRESDALRQEIIDRLRLAYIR